MSVPISNTLRPARAESRGPSMGPLCRVRLAATMLCASCAIFAFASDDEARPHAEGGRFHNNYPHEEHRSFWLWKWEELRDGVPQPPPGGWKIPHRKADAAALRANTSRPTVTWIGHST